MQIPESTIPTIKQLQKNGHKTFLCSGRSRSNINDKRLLGIGFDGIVAACGNHVEMDGKVLYENILSPELTEKLSGSWKNAGCRLCWKVRTATG